MSSLRFVGRNWSAGTGDFFGVETELRVTAVHDPPYVSIQRLPDGSYMYDGYLYDVWKIIVQSLNIRYQLMPLLDGGFGYLDVNGTWTGMVGEIAYGRADVALAWLWMRKDRLEVVDYLEVPVERSSDRFYFSNNLEDAPSLTGDMFNSLLKPLHTNVWWMLLGTLLVVSMVLRGTGYLSRITVGPTTNEVTWIRCMMSIFMSLVSQGWSRTPSSLSGRTVTIFTWFLSFIILNSYTATLISHLTVGTVNQPISSLKDFLAQSDWMLTMAPDHIHLNDWKISGSQYERELYQRVANKDRFIPFRRTKKSALGCIRPKMLTYVNIDRLFYLIENEACSLVPLHEQPVKGTSYNYMVMTKTRNSLRLAMNHVMRKLDEAGILSALKKRWIKRPGLCVSSHGTKPVSFGNSLALLMLVPIGLVASFIILVLECAWLKWKESVVDREAAPERSEP